MFQKGEKLSRSEVKTMIDEVDENKDGRLDYKEVSFVNRRLFSPKKKKKKIKES